MTYFSNIRKVPRKQKLPNFVFNSFLRKLISKEFGHFIFGFLPNKGEEKLPSVAINAAAVFHPYID